MRFCLCFKGLDCRFARVVFNGARLGWTEGVVEWLVVCLEECVDMEQNSYILDVAKVVVNDFEVRGVL